MDRWLEIWASVRSNKLRTFLSGFTIALALFVFITLFGLSKGLNNGFKEKFFPPDSKNIEVMADITSMPFRGKQKDRKIILKLNDYYEVKNQYKDKLLCIVPNINKSLTARYENEYGSYSLVGTMPDQKILKDNVVIKGRYLEEADGENLAKNIIIGRLVEKDLFKKGNAIGKELQLGNTLYHVVGVFSDEDGDNEERMIYMPIQTMQVIYGSSDIDGIAMLPKDDLSLPDVKKLSAEIEQKLKIKHWVHPQDTRGLRVWDATDALETNAMFFQIFTIIVFFIGGGSLIAGIVSIGNMMVFSVRERTKEIGIRKALGARPISIIVLILQETMTVTFLFGIVGIVAAVLLTNSIKDSLNEYLIYNPTVENGPIIMAGCILFFAGIVAGFLPAYRAAKIKPIEALRDGE